MEALAEKKTQGKEDFIFGVQLAWQRLSKFDAKVTPSTGMVLISAHVLEPCQQLELFRKWDNGMYSNPENETSYTNQY